MADRICSIREYLLNFYIFLENYGIFLHKEDFSVYSLKQCLLFESNLKFNVNFLKEIMENLNNLLINQENNVFSIKEKQNLLLKYNVIELILFICK